MNLTIDGRLVSAEPGTTILAAARSIGIDIPTLCYHETLTPASACRPSSAYVVRRRSGLPWPGGISTAVRHGQRLRQPAGLVELDVDGVVALAQSGK